MVGATGGGGTLRSMAVFVQSRVVAAANVSRRRNGGNP